MAGRGGLGPGPLRCAAAAGQRASSSAEGAHQPICTEPVCLITGSIRIPHGPRPNILVMDALAIALAIGMFAILIGLIYAIDRI